MFRLPRRPRSSPTQQGPGELFVVRNAGANIVLPYSDKPGGVTASIEHAVAVLGTPDIVVCGHSNCGAMTAIQSGSALLEKLPSVARWLHYAPTPPATPSLGPTLQHLQRTTSTLSSTRTS